jgi:hypothetical protein
MYVVRGEGPFADAVRKALEYAQSHGVDLSGVEVEVVPDPSITDAGAYTDHLGGLRFRIRYRPDAAGDRVLASHEAGHVAKWAWEYKKRGETQYIPNVDEPLAEAFGAVIARQLYGWPVTFKGAPMNLTQILPQRTTYITVTVDGKPITIKVPEWGDYRSRYKAGVFVAPYFYNVTNWAHVLGNFTAMPGDVIETVHKAWQSGAVEVVPGWGPVWRTTPTWTWTPTNNNQTTDNKNQTQTTTTTTTGDETRNSTTNTDAQKTNTSTATTSSTQPVVVPTQPAADVPLPPSDIQSPKYFSSDISPGAAMPPEWDSYINGRRVLVVLRNWTTLDKETLKDVRKDHVIGAGVMSGDRLRFEGRIPAPAVIDPNAWIEIVDEKTGKVLARLRSDGLYKTAVEGVPVTLYWSHVAAEEKWPGWERFVDRAKELDEKLGSWRPSGSVAPPPGAKQPRDAAVNPDGTVSAVKVSNAPTEYVPPKVPDELRRQFEGLLSDLKKLAEEVNPKNVNKVHEQFIQLRDNAVALARAWPSILNIDKANEVIETVAGAISKAYREAEEERKKAEEAEKAELEAMNRRLEALAKLTGLESFWKEEHGFKHSITYSLKYDKDTGVFMFTPWEGPKAGWTFVGYIKDDGTPVVVKETYIDSEAETEYEKLVKDRRGQTSGQNMQKIELILTQSIPTAVAGFIQTAENAARDAAGFLANALKTGAGVVLTALGGAKPSPAGDSEQQSDEQQFVTTTTPQTGSRPIYNRRRGMPALGGSPGSSQPSSSGYRPVDYLVSQHSEFARPPGGEQKKDEFVVKTGGGLIPPPVPAVETGGFVAARPSRPPDYVLAEEEARRAASAGTYSTALDAATQTSSGYRPADYLVAQQSSLSAPSAASPPAVQLSEPPQSSSKSHRRGRPVAVPT